MKFIFKLALALMVAMPAFVQAQTIEFWTTQTQSDRQKVIKALAQTFEALNPSIKVNVVPVEENDMAAQMAAASAAGKLPSIIEAGSELILAFGEENIVDLKTNNAIIRSVGKNKYFTGALDMVKAANGRDYYGVPFHGWIQGIWYRQDWFKEHGLAAPNSWNNILEAAKVLTDKSKNQYGILVGTKPETFSEQVFTHLALGNGARQFDRNGNLTFNSDEMLQTLRFYKELAQFNPPGPQTWRARDYYLQGKMGMFFYSTYIMDDLALADVAKGSLTSEHFQELTDGSFDPDLVKKTGFAPIIANTEKASYGVLVGLSVIKTNSAQAAAAKKFAEFLYQPDAYISFLHMAPGGMNPMIKGISNQSRYLNDPKGVFSTYGTKKIGDIIGGFENIKTFAIVNGKAFPQSGQITAKQIIPKMIYSVIFENVSPEAAIEKADREMKALIN